MSAGKNGLPPVVSCCTITASRNDVTSIVFRMSLFHKGPKADLFNSDDIMVMTSWTKCFLCSRETSWDVNPSCELWRSDAEENERLYLLAESICEKDFLFYF